MDECEVLDTVREVVELCDSDGTTPLTLGGTDRLGEDWRLLELVCVWWLLDPAALELEPDDFFEVDVDFLVVNAGAVWRVEGGRRARLGLASILVTCRLAEGSISSSSEMYLRGRVGGGETLRLGMRGQVPESSPSLGDDIAATPVALTGDGGGEALRHLRSSDDRGGPEGISNSEKDNAMRTAVILGQTESLSERVKGRTGVLDPSMGGAKPFASIHLGRLDLGTALEALSEAALNPIVASIACLRPAMRVCGRFSMGAKLSQPHPIFAIIQVSMNSTVANALNFEPLSGLFVVSNGLPNPTSVLTFLYYFQAYAEDKTMSRHCDTVICSHFGNTASRKT